MSGAKGALACVAIMWIAAILQIGMSDHVALWGARPDFLLVALAPMALLSRPAGGATLGFLSGLLQGALAGANLTHYVISRACAGFACSSLRLAGLDLGVVLGGVVAIVSTLVAQIILMLLAPPSDIPRYLGATIEMAMYNGVLAMPLYALLKRLFKTTAA